MGSLRLCSTDNMFKPETATILTLLIFVTPSCVGVLKRSSIIRQQDSAELQNFGKVSSRIGEGEMNVSATLTSDMDPYKLKKKNETLFRDSRDTRNRDICTLPKKVGDCRA